MSRLASPPALALLVVGALCLSGCGGAEEMGTPAAPSGPTTPAAKGMTVTHILIGMKGNERMKVARSPEDALELAKSILGDLQAGRPMEELIEKFTDDRDKNGKPNTNNGKPGSYDFPTTDGLAPEFAAAMKSLLPGKTTPDPVRTIFGYHIIRRDK
jgi:parvulin-like peptidyl-prolyl isomerase